VVPLVGSRPSPGAGPNWATFGGSDTVRRVSDLLAPPPDDEEESSRSRALWGLAALAVIAALVVVIIIATSGSGGHNSQQGLNPLASASSAPVSTPTAPASPTSLTVSTTTSSRASATPRSKATSAIPTSSGNPCRAAAAACPVPGDAGQLIGAVNQFRVSHGRPPVRGVVSIRAQQCALAQGVGPTCAPSYAWEPATTQNGPQVVSQMAGREHGTGWLLDPAMTSFHVGWAYAGGQYECAILKIR
jgi:hypothetical protein